MGAVFIKLKGKTMTLLFVQKLKFLALTGATAALVACGGGGGGTPQTINGNVTGNVAAGNVAALLGQTLTFPNGVPEFGTAAATTVAFGGTTAAPTATISSGGNTATANVSYGSCIFTVTSSSIPGILVVGSKVTVNPCTLSFATNGKQVSFAEQAVPMTIVFGTRSSVVTRNLVVNADGTVSFGGIVLGGLALTPVTGATGAGN